ncbi:four helix bundle protein [candidate division KSB1 bacterium]|nr:four helix bundle protein [candidate division KSB1 bacterium]
MPTFKSFEEIESWQKARELTRKVYTVSNQGAFTKDFGLRDQIRRASVSIMSNIAEGFERDGNREFLQFLAVAKGSSGEVRAQLYVALDQDYIDKNTFETLSAISIEIGSLIGGLMNYLRETDMKGKKFK